MPFNCQILKTLRALAVASACLFVFSDAAHADPSAVRLEHLHRVSMSVTHAMSTAQLLGQAMAKRAIGRSEQQFTRELSVCERLALVNFGEARWRLLEMDATDKLEELGYSERLFAILIDTARRWEGDAEEAFDMIEAIGVLASQLERLSAGLHQMSDDELTSLMQRAAPALALPPAPAPGPQASTSAWRKL